MTEPAENPGRSESFIACACNWAYGVAMDKKRDIYNPANPKAEEKKVYKDIELRMAQARWMTWRRVALFTVLLVGILAVTSWVIYVEEEKRRQAEEDASLADGSTLYPALQTNAPPVMSDRGVMLEDFEVSRNPAPEDMDPTQVAEAMGYVRVAEQYLRVRDWDAAEERVHQALEIWPDMNAARRTLGFIYTQRGQFDQAIAQLNEALKSDPANAETYNSLAACYMHKGLMDKAEDLLNVALQIRPDYGIAYINMGMLYLASGRYDLAADFLEQAVERVPGQPNVRNNLAVSLLRIGRLNEARDHLNHLIQNYPDMPAWYFNMAITYAEEKRFEDAMAWVRKGAKHCAPMQFHQYMSDSDFRELRAQAGFDDAIQELFPGLPAL